MDAHDLNLQTPATVWWVILIIGIAFIVGGIATALNRIEDRRRPGWKDATLAPGPEGVGKSCVEAVITVKDSPKFLGGRLLEARKVGDSKGPFTRCKPMVNEPFCERCGFLITKDDPNACRATAPWERWRIEWPNHTKD